ncbi:hypothetical protein Rcae01_00596 [Novipirellula caenicola]|uniref:Uncharacterized protein n=1 Tax=Novipirellula caenicola TaxID=1536901 RepID=A0ABP9VIW8_9BACT
MCGTKRSRGTETLDVYRYTQNERSGSRQDFRWVCGTKWRGGIETLDEYRYTHNERSGSRQDFRRCAGRSGGEEPKLLTSIASPKLSVAEVVKTFVFTLNHKKKRSACFALRLSDSFVSRLD